MIAWVQTRPDDPPPPPRPTATPLVEIVAAPVAEPQPTEVVLLVDDSVAVTPPVRGPAASRIAAASSNRPVGPKVEAATTVVPATTEPPAQRSPLMTMRRPDAPKLDTGLSSDFMEAFLESSRPPPPSDNPTTRLEEGLANVESNLKNSRWVANATAEQLTAARLERLALRSELNGRELQPDGAGKKAEHKTFRVKVAADGSATIHDKPNIQRKGLGATFDVTDAAMRSQGIDPYAAYKMKVLDETREERVAMGKQHRTQQLAQSKQHMHKNLERLWATTTDDSERKRGLFELWDECAETGTDELVAGGRSAREYVVGFIRSKFPAGSRSAYTRDELVRFNRQRRSRSEFAPY